MSADLTSCLVLAVRAEKFEACMEEKCRYFFGFARLNRYQRLLGEWLVSQSTDMTAS
jgi:hypothetical protein